MPVTCADLLKPIEEIVGGEAMLWPDGCYVNGSPGTVVKALLVTWMADVSALRKAVANKCNVVLCHESPSYNEKNELPPYRWLNPVNACAEKAWHPNRQRRMLIEKHRLTVMQCHYGLDRFPIYESFVEAIGLPAPRKGQGWEQVYRLPKAVTVAALAKTVKQRLRIAGTVRVTGDRRRKVQKVVSLWGGVGLYSNLYWLRRGIEHGADVAVAGEMDEFQMRFAAEAGIPVIETSHQLSEEIGLRHYAEVLRRRYRGLKVVSVAEGRPYWTAERLSEKSAQVAPKVFLPWGKESSEEHSQGAT